MNIKKLHLNNLRNNEHMSFMCDFKKLVDDNTATLLGIDNQYPAFLVLLANETEAIDALRASIHTKTLIEIDKKRKNIFRGLSHNVISASKHFDPSTQKAAKRLQVVFNTFGNINRKNNLEKTASYTNLLHKLQSDYTTEVTITGIEGWLAQLQILNNEYIDTDFKRIDQYATKTPLKMTVVRREIDTTYRQLTARINALIIVNGQNTYSNFVLELNLITDGYRKTLAIRKGRKAAKKQSKEANEAELGDVK